MRNELNTAISLLLTSVPNAYAFLYGNNAHPKLSGTAYFYELWGGTLMLTDVDGLPYEKQPCTQRYFGFSIHEGSTCTGTKEDPFADSGADFNPKNCIHPNDAGALPPLLGNRGYAFSLFYTDGFCPEEVIGKTLVLHELPNFHPSKDSDNSGEKVGCGVIMENSFENMTDE